MPAEVSGSEVQHALNPKTCLRNRMDAIMKKETPQTVNVAEVTRETLDLIMKLPGSERAALLSRLNPEARVKTGLRATATITTALIDAAMKLRIEERCGLLGELKAVDGSSRRKYSRIDFFSPIQYVVDGRLSNGFIKNISVNGLFLEDTYYTGPALQSGNAVTMIFNHPFTGKNMKIKGKITRITKAGLGIRFDTKL